MLNLKLTTVVVTYGNRWQYLKLVLNLLEREDVVDRVVLVDNASDYDLQDYCNKAGIGKILLYRNERNLGSAQAFSLGISIAIENGAEFLLLLDDDNLPRENAIAGLVKTYASLLNKISPDKFAVTAFRECQHGVRLPLKPLFMHGHDFLNFNIFNAIQRHFKFIALEDRVSSGPDFAAFHRGGPYGGMLFSKALIQNIGLPNPAYVLYRDDVDFIIRILSVGGVVWLDTDSIIDDIIQNYSVSLLKIPILGLVISDDDSKIYYIMRNMAYIDKNVQNKSSIYYKINKFTLIILVSLFCLVMLRFKRLVAIHEACWHARQDLLGLNPRYPI